MIKMLTNMLGFNVEVQPQGSVSYECKKEYCQIGSYGKIYECNSTGGCNPTLECCPV